MQQVQKLRESDTTALQVNARSYGQLDAQVRLAVMAFGMLLEKCGFISHDLSGLTSQNRLSYEKQGALVYAQLLSAGDLCRVAYVTSYKGYRRDAKSDNPDEPADQYKPVKAKVITAASVLQSELCVEVVLSGSDGTRKPIFVPVDFDSPSPARATFHNLLNLLKTAIAEIPSFKRAFANATLADQQFEDYLPAENAPRRLSDSPVTSASAES